MRRRQLPEPRGQGAVFGNSATRAASELHERGGQFRPYLSNKSVIGYSPAIALLAKNPVGVEKLFSQRSAEIGSRQDALGTIFSVRADIFYLHI